MKKKLFNLILVCNLALSPFLAPVGIYAEEVKTGSTSEEIMQTDSSSSEKQEVISTESTENAVNSEIKKVKIDKQLFPDENVRAAISVFDLDEDGYLSAEEIEKVTEIDLAGKGIEDTKGLEVFSNVKKISLANNNLKEFAPGAFPMLEELDVSGNHLQKIDLKKNARLIHFVGQNQNVSKQAVTVGEHYKISSDFGDLKSSVELISNDWYFDDVGNLVTESVNNTIIEYAQHIKLNSDSGVTESQLQVTIEVEFPDITFNSFSLEMNVGDITNLVEELELMNIITPEFHWESSNEEVVSVDQDATIEAIAVGSAVVKGVNQLNGSIIEINLNVSEKTDEILKPSVSYKVFVDGSWSNFVKDGETSGDLSLPIHGVAVELSDAWKQNSQVSMDILLSGQSEWQTSKVDLEGEGNLESAIDGIKLTLSGSAAESYSIFYRVKLKNYDWLSWASNGEPAGSQGIDESIVGLEIKIRPKAKAKLMRDEMAFMTKSTLPLPNLTYDAHSQSVGWLEKFKAGEEAGTTGKGLRLEAIRIFLENNTGKKGTIEYSTHVQTLAWNQGYVSSGVDSGTIGQKLRVEAMRIRLTDDLKEYFDIYYRVHSAKYGWLGWAKNGEEAGTSGLALPAEAYQVVIKRSGETAPSGNEKDSYISQENMIKPSVSYQIHQRTIGWGASSKDSVVAGTTGKTLRGEAIRISLGETNVPGGIEYKSHVQKKGWMPTVTNNSISGTVGQSLRMEAFQVKLTGELGKYYDIYYRAHVQSYGWLDWARNGQSSGSAGLAKHIEAIQIVIKKKGEAAPGITNKPFVEMEEFLFVMGHGGIDPGASYNGVNERDFTRGELLPYLRKYAAKLKNKKINFYDTNANMYADSAKGEGAYTISNGLKSVIEIHLDAGVANVNTGGHVIVHNQGKTATNLALAGTINKYVGLAGAYKGNGGLSYREDLLNLRVLKSRNIDYRLTELGFITNTRDVANIRRNIDSIAKNLVENVTGEKL